MGTLIRHALTLVVFATLVWSALALAKGEMQMIARVVFSVIALLCYGAFNVLYNPWATLSLGNVAGRQFENSDAASLAAQYNIHALQGVNGIATLVLLVVLVALWWGPVRRWIAAAALIAVLLLSLPGPAQAFFETTDKTEAYTILPNETAFWIPDVGANKDSQAQFESEDYFKDKKIPVKRFVIPHAKLTGSGGTGFLSGWDAFVPTGRLVIVDRTPYSREWVDAADRGTSKSKEGFPCQSKEGINVTAGVSIGVSVQEQNAAKYLYRFGVTAPQGNRNDPQVIFTSVYYSRKVHDVMDDVGRKRVQTLVCDEIGKRTFDQANAEMVPIMESVAKKASDYFNTVGITLDFIGWGDTFSFDHVVQDAINRRYVAAQDQVIGQNLAPYTGVIQALAQAESLRAFSGKFDGHLPTTFVGSPSADALMGGFLIGNAAKPVTTQPVAPAPAK